MTDDADTTAAPDPRPGIQPGQVTQRPESAPLHSSAQAVCQEVFQEESPRHPGLQWQGRLSDDEIYRLAGLRAALAEVRRR
jgi:hypothetical protein